MSDLPLLVFADKFRDSLSKPVTLPLGEKACRVDAFSQKTNIIQVILSLLDIKALSLLIIDNRLIVSKLTRISWIR